MTIIEFLTDRLDEDEADLGRLPEDYPYAPFDCLEPARVLADIAAKRRLVHEEPTDRCDSDYTCHAWDQWDRTCRILASVYADHPDYREEWKA